MMRDEMLEVWRQWQDVFARRDVHALADLYSDTAVFETPMAGSLTGREGIIQAHNTFFGAFPDAVLTAEPPIIDDGRIAVVAELAATHVGSFMGLPPTGKAIGFLLVVLLEVRDHRIVRDRRIYDFTGFLVQVGVLKARPA